MDPLSALGIAASVVQFVQFGGSLVSKSREIYKEGKTLDHVECEKASKRLLELTGRVKESVDEIDALGQLSPDSRALRVFCDPSINLSNVLVHNLDGLKVDTKARSRKWKSFRQALKSVCSKDKVDVLARELRRTQDELNIHLIGSIARKADLLAIRQEQALDSIKQDTTNIEDGVRKTIDAVIHNRELLKDDLSHQAKLLVESNAKSSRNVETSIIRALGDAQKAEIRLMQSLKFSGMNDRQMQIAEAHRRTFRWILDKAGKKNATGSNFIDWLERGSGVYWINGKAGSGKSTLMQYIFGESLTKDYLSTWADKMELEVTGFFFWINGSPEQRSYSGLLRSLLYQALCKRPDLVREVFPDELAQVKVHYADFDPAWLLPTLKAGFTRWISLSDASSRLCFFIDGLDEYDGDHEEMAEYLRDLSSINAHIKFCVSSRPWVAFDEAFKDLPSLRLQDLTFPDIDAYVFDKLESHHRMQQLVKADQNLALELVNELVSKASGVFLWVTLVVKSLLDGLRNRDTIFDLQRRLREIPGDLASLYSHMLGKVEQLYRQDAAKVFQIFSVMETQSVVPSIWFQVAITGETTHFQHGVRFYTSVAEFQEKLECLDIHLKTRCAGLLEIVGGINHHSREGYQSSIVSYLHRTVADFLRVDDVRLAMFENTDADFDPNIRAMIARIYAMKKCRTLDAEGIEGIWDFAWNTMTFAEEIENAEETSYLGLMEDLENAVIQCFQYYQEEVPEAEKVQYNPRRYFQLAVKCGLQTYVEERLKKWCSTTTDSATQLSTSVLEMVDESGLVTPANMYASILTGPFVEDPNRVYMGNSLWQRFLTEIHIHVGRSWMHQKYLKELGPVFQTMLERGANPYTTCIKNHPVSGGGGHTVRDVVVSTFETLLPDTCADLIEVLDGRIKIQDISEIQETDQRQQEYNKTGGVRPRKRGIQPKEKRGRKRKRQG